MGKQRIYCPKKMKKSGKRGRPFALLKGRRLKKTPLKPRMLRTTHCYAKPRWTCNICKKVMLLSNSTRHKIKIHGYNPKVLTIDSMVNKQSCTICGKLISLKNMARHCAMIHQSKSSGVRQRHQMERQSRKMVEEENIYQIRPSVVEKMGPDRILVFIVIHLMLKFPPFRAPRSLVILAVNKFRLEELAVSKRTSTQIICAIDDLVDYGYIAVNQLDTISRVRLSSQIYQGLCQMKDGFVGGFYPFSLCKDFAERIQDWMNSHEVKTAFRLFKVNELEQFQKLKQRQFQEEREAQRQKQQELRQYLEEKDEMFKIEKCTQKKVKKLQKKNQESTRSK